MSDTFTITAACAQTLLALGLDGHALAGAEVCIRDCIAEWDALLPEMQRPGAPAVTLRIDPPREGAPAAAIAAALAATTAPATGLGGTGFGTSSPNPMAQRAHAGAHSRTPGRPMQHSVRQQRADSDGGSSKAVGDDGESGDDRDGRPAASDLNATTMRGAYGGGAVSALLAGNAAAEPLASDNRDADGISSNPPESAAGTWARAQLHRVPLPALGKACWALHWQVIPPADSFAVLKAEARRRAALLTLLPAAAQTAIARQLGQGSHGAGALSNSASGVATNGWPQRPDASAMKRQPRVAGAGNAHGFMSPGAASTSAAAVRYADSSAQAAAAGYGGDFAGILLPPIAPTRSPLRGAPPDAALTGLVGSGFFGPGGTFADGDPFADGGQAHTAAIAAAAAAAAGRAGAYQGISDSSGASYLSGPYAGGGHNSQQLRGQLDPVQAYAQSLQAQQYHAAVAALQAQTLAQAQAQYGQAYFPSGIPPRSGTGLGSSQHIMNMNVDGDSRRAQSQGPHEAALSPKGSAGRLGATQAAGASRSSSLPRGRSWRPHGAGGRGRGDDEASVSGSAIFSGPDGAAVPLTGAALEVALSAPTATGVVPGAAAAAAAARGGAGNASHPFAAADPGARSPYSDAASGSGGSRSPPALLPPIAVRGTRLAQGHPMRDGARGSSALRTEVRRTDADADADASARATATAAAEPRADVTVAHGEGPGSPTVQGDPLRELLQEGGPSSGAPVLRATVGETHGISGRAATSQGAAAAQQNGSTSQAAEGVGKSLAEPPVPTLAGAAGVGSSGAVTARKESASPIVGTSADTMPQAGASRQRHSFTGSETEPDTFRATIKPGVPQAAADGLTPTAAPLQPLRGWNSTATAGSLHQAHPYYSATDIAVSAQPVLTSGSATATQTAADGPGVPGREQGGGSGRPSLAPLAVPHHLQAPMLAGGSAASPAAGSGYPSAPPGILKMNGQSTRPGGRSSVLQLPGGYGQAPGSAAAMAGASGVGFGAYSSEDPRLTTHGYTSERLAQAAAGDRDAASGAGTGTGTGTGAAPGSGQGDVNGQGQPQGQGPGRGLPFGDNKSATSGGSGSTHKALTRLRRVLADSQQPLLPGLKYLRIAGLAVTVLSVGLAAAIVAVTIQSFAQYQQAVAYTRDGGHRITATFASINSAQELINAAKGWTPFDSPAAEAATRNAIINNMTTFTTLHKSMYDFATGTDIEDTYTRRDITILRFDVPGGNVRGAPTILNLVEVGLAFAAELKTLAHIPLANLSNWLNPAGRYLQANLMPRGWAHEELKDSLNAGFTLAYQSRLDLRHTQIIIYASMAALLLALALFVFLPILVSIEAAKDAIVVSFVQLPPVVKRMLFVQSVRRARTLRRNYLSTDEDDDDENDGDDDGDDEAAAMGLTGGANGGGGGDEDHAGEYAGGQVAGAPPFLAVAIGGEGDEVMDGDGEDIDWGAVMERAEGASSGGGGKFGSSRTRSSKSVGSASALMSPGQGSQFGRINSVGSAGGTASGGRAAASPAAGLRTGTSKVAPGQAVGSNGLPLSPSGRIAAGSAASPSAAAASRNGRSASLNRGLGGSKSGRSGSGSAAAKAAAAAAVKPFRKSWRSFMLLLLRFQGPLLALLVFFSVTFGVSMHELDTTLALSSAALAATDRATCSRELVMDLRRLVGTWAERPFVKARYLDLAEVRDCINYNNQLLAFGRPPGPSRGLHVPTTPVLESGSAAAALLGRETSEVISGAFFGDACDFAAQSPFRLQEIPEAEFRARCASWSSGLMKEGLEATMSEYLRRMSVVADERLRARMGSPGKGVVFPEGTYNYTVDTCKDDSAMNCFIGELTPEGLPYGGTDGLPATCWENGQLVCRPMPATPVFSYTGDFMWAADGATPLNFSMAATGATAYRVADVLKAEDIAWLEDADKLFLTPSLFAAADSYSAAAIESVGVSMEFLVAFSAAFLSAFVIFMFAVFVPAVRRTNADVTSRRGMLLYLPPEVASKSRSIKALVQSILAADSERSGLGVPTIAALGLATSASAGRMAADADSGAEEAGAGGSAAAGGARIQMGGAAAAARMSDEPALPSLVSQSGGARGAS